jgi:hypothetical protein
MDQLSVQLPISPVRLFQEQPFPPSTSKRNQAREAQADDQGSFNIQNLQPGLYDVKTDVAGFRSVQPDERYCDCRAPSRVSSSSWKSDRLQSPSAFRRLRIALQTDKSGTQSQIDTKPIGTLP